LYQETPNWALQLPAVNVNVSFNRFVDDPVAVAAERFGNPVQLLTGSLFGAETERNNHGYFVLKVRADSELAAALNPEA
jgi:hypothetical protein